MIELLVQRNRRTQQLRLVVLGARCYLCGFREEMMLPRHNPERPFLDDGWPLVTFRQGCSECGGPLGQVWLTAREEALMQLAAGAA